MIPQDSPPADWLEAGSRVLQSGHVPSSIAMNLRTALHVARMGFAISSNGYRQSTPSANKKITIHCVSVNAGLDKLT